jgi:hypothetical protein
MKVKASIWRNRIVGYGEENPDQLLGNEKNWRIHPKVQQDTLSGALREVGIVQNVIVNLRKGSEWPDGERGISTVIDGHLRISMAISENQPTIPITYVDISPEEEVLVLATLDPITGMAATDRQKLEDLLKEVSTSDEAIQNMLKDMANANGILSSVNSMDYSSLDKELDGLKDSGEETISITVPQKYLKEVREWLANGEGTSAAALGKGVLKRCGLL